MLNEKLAHLSHEEICALIDRYYAGEKIQELISEYEIDVHPSGLVRIFPPIVCDDLLCPYCNIYLTSPRTSRGGFVPRKNPSCEACGHRVQGCNCQHCREQVRAINRNIHERKQDLVYSEFPCCRPLPDPTDIRLEDALYLLAIANHSLSEDFTVVEPFTGRVPLAPTFEFQKEMTEQLYARGFISISPDSKIDSFIFNEEITVIKAYYPTEVIWEFMPSDDVNEKRQYLAAVRAGIGDTWPQQWTEDLQRVWRKVAKYECLEYFLYLLEKRNFSLDKIGDKTHAVFEELLEDFSVSQIFNLTWQAVRDATDYIVSEDIPSYHGKNVFIGSIQRKGRKAKAERWDVRHSRRDYNCPQTIVSATLSDLILGLGQQAFEMVAGQELPVLSRSSKDRQAF